MGKSLVIVESPAKAKTIERYLGNNFKVLATYGHVRALPSKQGAVDIQNDFMPKYIILPHSKKHIDAIKNAIKSGVKELYLATDLDREGEAIAWHLLEAIGGGRGVSSIPVRRIIFNEITKDAIIESIKNPRDISYSLVDAQKGRVILDYLYGFNLSPFLWKKVKTGLSAGRVQSVALRLICEREKEIESFVKVEYWSVKASLQKEEGKKEVFEADLVYGFGKKIERLSIKNEDEVKVILEALKGASFSVSDVRKKEVKRTPPPPFITSTLQQEGVRKLGFPTKKTMMLAQKLYEGVEINGESVALITYMRTDSVELSSSAVEQAKRMITSLYGKEYSLGNGRVFKSTVKNAQEAHEAIRPVDISRIPDSLNGILSSDLLKLYRLIWKRTVASQMANAVFDSVSVDIEARKGKEQFVFRGTGSTIKFDGFLKVYSEGVDDETKKEEEKLLPPLIKNEILKLLEIKPERHFTQPPPRYSEATLVKTLEEYGIGRPSTYASIISTLLEREYVKLADKRFIPLDVGIAVSQLLTMHFPKYVDYNFTAEMEGSLDEIAKGKIKWQPMVRNFWEPFITLIKQKEKDVTKYDAVAQTTEEICPECGKSLVKRLSKFGKYFLACSGYPECKYARNVNGLSSVKEEPILTDEKCELCGSLLAERQGRFGKFLGCSKYPECKYIKPKFKPEETKAVCPKCKDGKILKKLSKKRKIFFSCSNYPKCDFASWSPVVNEKCPECGSLYLLEKTGKKGTTVSCPAKECGYVKNSE